MPREDAPRRYPIRVEVDGERFVVEKAPGQAGTFHYAWVSGPNPGYGFTSGFAALDEGTGRISHDHRPTLAEHLEDIRDFMSQVDPETGYIE